MAIKNVIGIDLGTVNSCVAVVKDDKPIPLYDEQDRETVPSVFAIDSNEHVLVGYEAEAQADMNRLNTIFAAKRLIGRKYDSPDVQEAMKKLPYKIVPAKNGDAWVEVNGAPMSPEEVSAAILRHMKKIAEYRLGEEVTHAVISVPAHFNDSQRQATRDAGAIAGLTVLNIINEPTAAALAYGIDVKEGQEHKSERLIAVFDLGGGTFDITVLGLVNGLFDVRSTGGDTFLGGEDFDLAMVAWLLEEFRKQADIDLKRDKAALQRIKTAARNARHELSFQPTVELKVPFLSSGTSGTQDLTVVLHRKEMEKLFGHLVVRLDAPSLKAMADAGIHPDDLDDVVLVGGMTRMPVIRRQCKKIFGKQPIDTVNPDTAVAVGAAIQGALMQGILSGVNLADVTPLTLGVEVQGGFCVPIIPRNSKVPAKVTRMFSTSGPNQSEINIHVVQGESQFAFDNKSLGLFTLTDIPPAPRGKPKIAVSLNVDTDGIVHVAAMDEDTGDKKSLQIFATSGLSEENLNKLVRDNRTLEVEDKRRDEKMKEREAEVAKKKASDAEELAKRRDINNFINNLDSEEVKKCRESLRTLLFETQFSLDAQGKKFKGEARDALDRCLQYARQTLEHAKSEEELNATMEEINQLSQPFRDFLENS